MLPQESLCSLIQIWDHQKLHIPSDYSFFFTLPSFFFFLRRWKEVNECLPEKGISDCGLLGSSLRKQAERRTICWPTYDWFPWETVVVFAEVGFENGFRKHVLIARYTTPFQQSSGPTLQNSWEDAIGVISSFCQQTCITHEFVTCKGTMKSFFILLALLALKVLW